MLVRFFSTKQAAFVHADCRPQWLCSPSSAIVSFVNHRGVSRGSSTVGSRISKRIKKTTLDTDDDEPCSLTGQMTADLKDSAAINELRRLKGEIAEMKDTIAEMKGTAAVNAQELRSLKGEMAKIMKDTIQTEINQMNRLQSLAWACGLIGDYEYFHDPSEESQISARAKSKNLVQDILLAFRSGHGWKLPDVMSLKDKKTHGSKYEEEKDRVAVQLKNRNTVQIAHSKLIEQIHGLTGSKPKIEWSNGEQGYTIYGHKD
jgi:hypothetical protein